MLSIQLHRENKNVFTKWKEFEIVFQYCITRDISILANLLRSPEKISPVMRNVIANVLEGKSPNAHYQPVSRRKHDPDRDFVIAFEVHQHLKTINHLRANKAEPGAATIVGEKYHLSEDAIIKIYELIIKQNVDMDNSTPCRVNEDGSIENGLICYKNSYGNKIS